MRQIQFVGYLKSLLRLSQSRLDQAENLMQRFQQNPMEQNPALNRPLTRRLV